MEAEAIQFGLVVTEELIKNEPAIAQEIHTLLSKGDPTPADWQALRARVTANPYEKYDSTPIAGVTDAEPVPIKILPAPTENVASNIPTIPNATTPPPLTAATVQPQPPLSSAPAPAITAAAEVPAAAVVSSAAPATNILQLPTAPPQLTELELKQQIEIDELNAQIAALKVPPAPPQPPIVLPVPQAAPVPDAAVEYAPYHE